MATKPALKTVEKTEEEIDGEAPPPKKKGKKLLVITLLLLILLGGSGGAAWYFLMHKAGDGKQEKNEVTKPSFYLPLENFTVNLQSDGSGNDHFLQIGITLQLSEDKVGDSIKQQLPLIRNKLLLLLSGKTPADLSSMEGKRKLATEILAETRSSLPEGGPVQTPDKGVQNVLFSSLIVQ